MKNKFLRTSFLIGCLLSALGLAQAQPGTARPALSAPPAPQASAGPQTSVQVAGPVSVPANYVIGASDIIIVDVRDANLQRMETESGTLPVRPDGYITLPLLGDVQAAGFTAPQLAADIAARLTKYYVDPIVTVSVQQVLSKQVFMAGEGISRGGPMTISPGMTILQAIASAGLTPYANKKHIYILRGDPANQKKIPFDYNKAIKTGDLQGVSLVPGDTIVIN